MDRSWLVLDGLLLRLSLLLCSETKPQKKNILYVKTRLHILEWPIIGSGPKPACVTITCHTCQVDDYLSGGVKPFLTDVFLQHLSLQLIKKGTKTFIFL